MERSGRTAYEPYGAARTTTQNDPSAPANLIRFGGKHLDESGFYSLKARLYDPSSGRFASQSPLPRDRSEPSTSGYAYVDNQPTSRVSPNGTTSAPPPASEGCGPGISRCSLRKLASEACPPPMFPYGGLPGFKPYWLAGYYAVCEGQRGMLRGQLGLVEQDERASVCQQWSQKVLIGIPLTVGGPAFLVGGLKIMRLAHRVPVTRSLLGEIWERFGIEHGGGLLAATGLAATGGGVACLSR